MKYTKLLMISVHFIILACAIPNFASASLPLEESDKKVKFIVHIHNENFGPGNEPFDKRQNTAVSAFTAHSENYQKNTYFTLKKNATDHFGDRGFREFGYYPYTNVYLKFDVRMQGENQTLTTKGVVFPYDLREYVGKFFDISLDLNAAEWHKVRGYGLTLEAQDARYPGNTGTHKTRALSGIFTYSISNFYEAPKKNEYHIFTRLTLDDKKTDQIVNMYVDQGRAYEDYKKQTPDSLQYIQGVKQ